jgi:hypothetical protein
MKEAMVDAWRGFVPDAALLARDRFAGHGHAVR